MTTGANENSSTTVRGTTAEVSREMAATPEQVWAVLADGWLYASWVVGASRIREVEGAWPAVGSKIHHSVGSWPLLLDDDSEVVESTPARRLVLQARGRPLGEARITLELEPAPVGSVVRMLEDATSGPGTLMPKPLRRRASAAVLDLLYRESRPTR